MTQYRIQLWQRWLLAAVLGTLIFNLCYEPSCHAQVLNAKKPQQVELDQKQTSFIKYLFKKYGDDKVMTFEGFKRLLSLYDAGNIESDTPYHNQSTSHDHGHGHSHDHDHEHEHEHKSDQHGHGHKEPEDDGVECLNATDILRIFGLSSQNVSISHKNFLYMCPAIVYSLDHPHCSSSRYLYSEHDDDSYPKNAWLFSICGVSVISLLGILCVASIPILQRFFFQQIIQFLVALAVGALSGDAVLHLLPHAFTDEADDPHDRIDDGVNPVIWKGLAALGGIYLFFLTERLIQLIRAWRLKVKNRRALRSDIFESEGEQMKTVGEKLCKHKYNSYGYCYGDVSVEVLQGLNDNNLYEESSSELKDDQYDECLNTEHVSSSNPEKEKELLAIKNSILKNSVNNHNHCHNHGHHHHHHSRLSLNETINDANAVEGASKKKRPSKVSQHSHGHDHGHGHSHNVPGTFASAVWMIIAGDGIHNFCDGLAIGTSFAQSIPSGLSTCIAVLCHELPHELGDFAILLKAGLSVRQAMLCNCLSSVLCFLGMTVGMAMGNVDSASSWVFAGAAGMFLYLSLVDMMPELQMPQSSDENAVTALLLHISGLCCGVGTMLLIAIYEHELHEIFPQ